MTLASSPPDPLASLRTRPLFAAGLGVLALAAIFAAPWLARPFTITLLTEAYVFAIWAMSLNLLSGHAGLLSFGHAAGFGLGGYAAGYFAREVTADIVAALLFAEAVVFVVAALAGAVATRLSGVAFSIVSLCIAQVLYQVAIAWRAVTEGMDGLLGVPLPRLVGFTIRNGVSFYFLVAAVMLATLAGLALVLKSPFGATLRAIRTNDVRAASIGIDVRLHKWLAFVISWMLAGVAGALMVFLKAGTTPMSLHWSESGNVLIMTIFGGLGTIVGPVIGAVCFVFLRDALTSALAVWQLAFGLIFVVVVVIFPSGLAGLPAQLGKLSWRSSR
ncbi:branched-chain amino acid ABC transporter permease [Bradyrhizobium sp. HKCCYLR20261]|uniref:branched-chain amino acid ABC transporter permease n=1 Tax=Bradyrhizobium sp. HKCCYLR20261 TaxID=3420760 RepID=UPI003EBF178F